MAIGPQSIPDRGRERNSLWTRPLFRMDKTSLNLDLPRGDSGYASAVTTPEDEEPIGDWTDDCSGNWERFTPGPPSPFNPGLPQPFNNGPHQPFITGPSRPFMTGDPTPFNSGPTLPINTGPPPPFTTAPLPRNTGTPLPFSAGTRFPFNTGPTLPFHSGHPTPLNAEQPTPFKTGHRTPFYPGHRPPFNLGQPTRCITTPTLTFDARSPLSANLGLPARWDGGLPKTTTPMTTFDSSPFGASWSCWDIAGHGRNCNTVSIPTDGKPEDAWPEGAHAECRSLPHRILGTVVTELSRGPHFRGAVLTFGILIGPHAHVEPSTLNTFITGPSGQKYGVAVERQDDHHLICFSRPQEIGLFVGCVYVGSVHLPGSPFEFYAERDYEAVERPIITMDAEMVISNGRGRLKQRKPWGITCNTKTEQIFVTDREHHEVLIYSPEGDLLGSFGERGYLPGQFNRPTGIAFDASLDRLLLTDKDNHRVQAFDCSGDFLGQFGRHGTAPGQFRYPWGIAVSKFGMIVVADSRNHRVQLFNPTGKLLNVVCHPGLQFPRGVAFSPSGAHVYVSDFNGHSVFKASLDLSFCELLVVTGLLRPSGLAVDDCGNLLVADSRNHTVKVFSPTGRHLNSIRTLGHLCVDLPTDIAVMKGGFIAIFDFNGRIIVA